MITYSVFKNFIKKVRRDWEKLGKLYKKKDELKEKLSDIIYGESVEDDIDLFGESYEDNPMKDMTVEEYFENAFDTFFDEEWGD